MVRSYPVKCLSTIPLIYTYNSKTSLPKFDFNVLKYLKNSALKLYVVNEKSKNLKSVEYKKYFLTTRYHVFQKHLIYEIMKVQ